jgi:hypothetical protein
VPISEAHAVAELDRVGPMSQSELAHRLRLEKSTVSPMLLRLRLRRRFATWWAPAIALAIFVAMFTVSAVVLGPALRAGATDPPAHEPAPSGPVPTGSHAEHHR